MPFSRRPFPRQAPDFRVNSRSLRGFCSPAGVQHGFRDNFLQFFEFVHNGDTACGKAFRNRTRVVVEDVGRDLLFRDTAAGDAMLKAEARAVQSTPLIGCSRDILGVISTHWYYQSQLLDRDFGRLDRLAENTARWLEQRALC